MITASKSITLSTTDHLALAARLARHPSSDPRNRDLWKSLREELGRAALLAPEAMPPGIVRIGSVFTIRDIDFGDVDTFTLVWPEHADVARGRLSVLTPLGVAIIGYSVGDEIAWPMPGGLRRMTLLKVTPPTTASSNVRSHS